MRRRGTRILFKHALLGTKMTFYVVHVVVWLRYLTKN